MASSAVKGGSVRQELTLATLFLGLPGLVWLRLGTSRRRKGLLALILGGVLMLMVLGLVACGGSAAAPQVTQVVRVTGTSNGSNQSTTFTLTVQ